MANITQQVRPWWDKAYATVQESITKEYIREVTYEATQDSWGSKEGEKGEHNKILQKVAAPSLPRASFTASAFSSRLPLRNLALPQPVPNKRRFADLTCAYT